MLRLTTYVLRVVCLREAKGEGTYVCMCNSAVSEVCDEELET